MFAITVTEKGGEQRRLDFDKAEVTIGRVQGNDVILPKGNVSKRHARIVLKDGKFIIVDLKSTNGTYVNGRKITSPLVVKESDKIYIGDFILGVDEGGAAAAAPGPDGAHQRVTANRPAADFSPPGPPPPQPVPPPPVSAPDPAPAPSPAPRALAPQPSAPESLPPTPSGPMGGGPGPGPGLGAPAPAPAPLPSPVSAPAPVAQIPAIQSVSAPAQAPAQMAQIPAAQSAPAPTPIRRAPSISAPKARSVAPLRKAVEVVLEPSLAAMLPIQRSLLERAVATLELDTMAPERLMEEDLWERAESTIKDLIDKAELDDKVDEELLLKHTLNEALGLGPLEDLLADDSVSEIIVDRPERVLISREGELGPAGCAFSSEQALTWTIERLAAPAGVDAGNGSPVVNTRLRDGAQLSAALPPAASAPCLVLRKRPVQSSTLDSLIAGGCLSREMSSFLDTCISGRRNVLVCSTADADLASVLGALVAKVPAGERIVGVEGSRGLGLAKDVLMLSADEAPDQVVRSAVAMKPDCLVVELEPGTAVEAVGALASSCDGAFATVASASASGGLLRVAACTGTGLPGANSDGVRDLVACAFDLVVCVTRFADGVTRIASISEVMAANSGGFHVQDLFGYGADGFSSTGVVPEFYSELKARGIALDASIF